MEIGIPCLFYQVIQRGNQHFFSRRSGGHSTCNKLFGPLTPFDMSFEVPKKVLVILVHQGAAKLPALKHFLHSKKAFCVVDFPILMQQRL